MFACSSILALGRHHLQSQVKHIVSLVASTKGPRSSSPRSRIAVLDALRGVALLGMVAVHVTRLAHAPQGPATWAWTAEVWLLQGKARTMFALLFGAGFALQLNQARERGVSFKHFAPKYLWRMLLLWSTFGLLCEALFENEVLLRYAVFGSVILLLCQLRTRYLVAIVCSCMVLPSIVQAVDQSRHSPEVVAAREAQHEHRVQTALAIHRAESKRSLSEVSLLKVRRELWRTAQWRTYEDELDVLGVLLIGFLAVRYGVFARPSAHRRLIAAAGASGAFLWGIERVLPPRTVVSLPGLDAEVSYLFRVQPERWLALLYIALILMVFASDAAWGRQLQRRLSVLAPTGRMALTWFVIHQGVLLALFTPYGLNLGLPVSRAAAGILLAGMAISIVGASLLWMRYFRYGPLEWLWRCGAEGHFEAIHRYATREPAIGAFAPAP